MKTDLNPRDFCDATILKNISTENEFGRLEVEMLTFSSDISVSEEGKLTNI
jgi:hypothetical protein